MADLVAFDAQHSRPLLDQLNRQGFLERSIVTSLRSHVEYGRGIGFFGRSDTTTFETHKALGCVTATALSTTVFARDVMLAVPFVAEDAYAKNLVECEVTTGSASSKINIGVYDSTVDLNGTPYPGKLVCSATALSGAGAAVVSGTITTTLVRGRLYFAAYLCGAATGPTLRSIPQANLAPYLGWPSGLGANPQHSYTVASTYAASGLPISFPSGATANTAATVPAVFLRSSGVATETRYVPAFSPTYAGYVLRRVKLWSATGTSLSTGISTAYYTIAPSLRTGAATSSLGTFDTRTSRLAAGEVYYLNGPAEIDLNVAADSILETVVTSYGWSDQSLDDVNVQWDIAFTGAQV